MKLNKVSVDDWLKALRDGSHKKGTFFLNKGGKFCCIGVLYDLCNKTKWEPTKEGNANIMDCKISGEYFRSNETSEDRLLEGIMKVGDSSFKKIDTDLVCKLMDMNDRTSYSSSKNKYVPTYTFKKIANVIERKLK